MVSAVHLVTDAAVGGVRQGIRDPPSAEPDELRQDASHEVAERLPVGAHRAGVVGVLPLADVVVDVLDEGAEPDAGRKHGDPGMPECIMTNGPG
jgi:hypothetical protein